MLPDLEFDLVVNHAAAHHIAAIDRVFREVCRLLPVDGWFVSFDYVGPHRNQYRTDAWDAAWEINRQLPESLRQDMAYPPIPVMLQVDPTEAIHSELIVETFHRYFIEREFTPLGGALAYPLLTHNHAMFGAQDNDVRARSIDRILEADDEFLRDHPDSSLFAYFAGTPNKSVLERSDLLEAVASAGGPSGGSGGRRGRLLLRTGAARACPHRGRGAEGQGGCGAGARWHSCRRSSTISIGASCMARPRGCCTRGWCELSVRTGS